MKNNAIYVSELSTSTHVFCKYHFCRGNSNKRKTRLGLIRKGHGSYLYLNKRLEVREGDLVFIPENVYCYSEWHGEPEIEVVYVSGFLHYDAFRYEPQVIDCDEDAKGELMRISTLLSSEDLSDTLEGYSLFYKLLQHVLPRMKQSDIVFDKTLLSAVEYITENWNQSFGVPEIAKKCYTSESTIYHLFQRELGQTPVQFLHSVRINMAIEYLENTAYSISTVSKMTGFQSEGHFRKVFTEHTGTTPLKFRKSKG